MVNCYKRSVIEVIILERTLVTFPTMIQFVSRASTKNWLGSVKMKGFNLRSLLAHEMHYLRWTSWSTAKALASAGVSIDTTMGYAEKLSFRSGTCHPYYPFCIEEDCQNFVKIIPLTIMEGTVWGENYMNIQSPEEIISAMKKQIDKVKEVKGTINILWHNSDLDEHWKKNDYSEIIKICVMLVK